MKYLFLLLITAGLAHAETTDPMLGHWVASLRFCQSVEGLISNVQPLAPGETELLVVDLRGYTVSLYTGFDKGAIFATAGMIRGGELSINGTLRAYLALKSPDRLDLTSAMSGSCVGVDRVHTTFERKP